MFLFIYFYTVIILCVVMLNVVAPLRFILIEFVVGIHNDGLSGSPSRNAMHSLWGVYTGVYTGVYAAFLQADTRD